jgi:hypothetical protein
VEPDRLSRHRKGTATVLLLLVLGARTETQSVSHDDCRETPRLERTAQHEKILALTARMVWILPMTTTGNDRGH